MARLRESWSLWLAMLSAILGLAAYLLINLPLVSGGWMVLQTVLDGIFFTFKMFAGVAPMQIRPEGPYGVAAAVMLNIARFTAPAALLATFLSRFNGLWLPAYIGRKLRRLRRFDVLYGNSDLVAAFHAGNRREGVWTVQILPDVTGGATISHEADLIRIGERDFQSLAARHRLTPRALVLMDGDDGANVETAAAGALADVDCDLAFLHIGDEMLRLAHVAFSAGEDGTRFQTFNAHELAARVFFQTNDVFLRHVEAGFAHVHLVCLEFGEDTLALVLQLVKIGWHPALGRPRITILTTEAAVTERLFAQRFGGLAALADITVRPWADRHPWFSEQTDALRDDPASLFYVSEALGRQRRRIALDVMDSVGRLGDEPLFLLLQPTIENLKWVRRQLAPGGLDLSCLAPSRDFLSVRALSGVFDRIARSYHEAYESRGGGTPERTEAERREDWMALPENFKASNRRAADGAKTKLEALGLPGPVDEVLAGPPVDLAPSTELLEALSEAEHKSWYADRIIGGWRHGETRDNRRKLHPDLVPYAELSEEVKALDRLQIKTLLDMLPRADGTGDATSPPHGH